MLPLPPLPPKVTVATLEYAPAGFHPEVLTGIYGKGTQDAYRAAADQAIESVAQKALAYKVALLESATTKNPFLGILRELSQRRQQHAIEAQSPAANGFGQRRELAFSHQTEHLMILLGFQYRETGDHLKAAIAAKFVHHLDAIAKTALPPTTRLVLDDQILGQRTRITFDLKDVATLNAIARATLESKKGGSLERYKRYVDADAEFRYDSGDLLYRAIILRTPRLRAITATRITAGELPEKVLSEGVALLRKQDQKKLFSDFKLYKEELASGRCRGEVPRAEPYLDDEHRKIACAMEEFKVSFPVAGDPIEKIAISRDVTANARTHFLMATLSHTLELASMGADESRPQRRFEPLTRYFIPLQVNPGESVKSSLPHMLAHAIPLVLHQDVHLIQETLHLCSTLFTKIMLWKASESPNLLKEQMAGMIWLLAHNHRDERGTASETEWLERAIYRSHGLAIRALRTRMIDCVALSTPLLSEFVPAYSDSFTLEPLPQMGARTAEVSDAPKASAGAGLEAAEATTPKARADSSLGAAEALPLPVSTVAVAGIGSATVTAEEDRPLQPAAAERVSRSHDSAIFDKAHTFRPITPA